MAKGRQKRAKTSRTEQTPQPRVDGISSGSWDNGILPVPISETPAGHLASKNSSQNSSSYKPSERGRNGTKKTVEMASVLETAVPTIELSQALYSNLLPANRSHKRKREWAKDNSDIQGGPSNVTKIKKPRTTPNYLTAKPVMTVLGRRDINGESIGVINQRNFRKKGKTYNKTRKRPLLRLSKKILLQIAGYLELKDLSCLFRTSRPFSKLLTPLLHQFATLDRDGLPALLWAAQKGHDELVRILLDLGLDPNREYLGLPKPDDLASTPLCKAAIYGHTRIVDLLLEKSADPNFWDSEGRTALHHAIASTTWCTSRKKFHTPIIGATEKIVESLLKDGADINCQTGWGDTPLHCATRCHNEKARKVKILLENGANPEIDNEDGNTPLHSLFLTTRSATAPDAEVITAMILAKGINIDRENTRGHTVLSQAVKYRAHGVVKILLERGADAGVPGMKGEEAFSVAERLERLELNFYFCRYYLFSMLSIPRLHEFATLDKGSLPPLIWAARYGHEELAQFLLGLGFDPNQNWIYPENADFGNSALSEAALYGYERIVDLLLKHSADPNFTDLQQCTALHYSMESFSIDTDENWSYNPSGKPLPTWSSMKATRRIVKSLLKAGANIDARDFYGRTALHYALEAHEPIEKVKLLLSSGANPDIGDEDGNTPLHYSVNLGWKLEASLELLSARTANIDLCNDDKETALYRAVCRGRENAVRILLESGANPNIGKPALEPASACDEVICGLLLEAGAYIETQDVRGTTILNRAISNNSYKTVELLLENGANVTHLDRAGRDVLGRALRKCIRNPRDLDSQKSRQGCIISQLLENYPRLDVETADRGGNTLLHRASMLIFPQVVQLLLKKGANPNSRNRKGRTVLHELIDYLQNKSRDVHFYKKQGLDEVISLLLDNGADINAKDSKGNTPLDRAEKDVPGWCGYPARILLEKGGSSGQLDRLRSRLPEGILPEKDDNVEDEDGEDGDEDDGDEEDEGEEDGDDEDEDVCVQCKSLSSWFKSDHFTPGNARHKDFD